MRVELYEKVFLWLTAGMLVAALAAIGVSVALAGVSLPGPAGRLDPRLVRQTAPFDQPGLRQVAPRQYEAVLLAQTWSYTPNEIRIPAGSHVTFIVTSADVIHGLLIQNTDVNAMIVPGQVTRVHATFHAPGEYLFLCHEYCGLGHHTMAGRVVAE